MLSTPEITLLDAGFQVQEGTRRVPVRWADVRSVTASKRDELTTDLICLEFGLKDDLVLLVHEEMAGWDALLREAPRFLSGMPTSDAWLPSVIQPPFATNATLLFQVAGSPA